MNKNIKITLDLDGNQASETIDKIEQRADLLIEKLSAPVMLNLELRADESTVNKIRLLMNELNTGPGINPPPGNIPYNKEKENAKETESRLKISGKNFSNHQAEMTAAEKKYSAQRQKIATEEYRHKLDCLDTMLFSTGVIFGRQTEMYKILSLAEATISAYNAANAALLPPPIGAGPILGEIQAGLVLMNSLKRVEKIASTKIPGYAKGGIIVGENGPEVIENMQDYAEGRAELVQKTILALQTGTNSIPGFSGQLVSEIKDLRKDLNTILSRPAVAFLDDREAKKVYYSGNYSARKTR